MDVVVEEVGGLFDGDGVAEEESAGGGGGVEDAVDVLEFLGGDDGGSEEVRGGGGEVGQGVQNVIRHCDIFIIVLVLVRVIIK